MGQPGTNDAIELARVVAERGMKASASDAGVAALQSGQVDNVYDPRPSDFQALKDNPDLTVRPASTSQCLLVRMRVDLEPWDDVRVRNALRRYVQLGSLLKSGADEAVRAAVDRAFPG